MSVFSCVKKQAGCQTKHKCQWRCITSCDWFNCSQPGFTSIAAEIYTTFGLKTRTWFVSLRWIIILLMSLKSDFPTVPMQVDSQNVGLNGYGTPERKKKQKQHFPQQLVDRNLWKSYCSHLTKLECLSSYIGTFMSFHELKAQSDIYTDVLKWNEKNAIYFFIE